jgi:DNA repair exonuclease SbcCD ATPase subunit
MNKKLQKNCIEFSDSTQSPISFSSIGLSPIPSKKSAKAVYKSPENTPCSSPKITSIKSAEESFQFQIEKRLSLRNTSSRRDSLSALVKKLEYKEKHIKVLEEENKRLNRLKSSDKWEKELVQRNEDLRKLESQLNYFRRILNEKIDARNLIETIETQSKKIAELEILTEQLQKGLCRRHEQEIKELRTDNIALITLINEYEKGPSKDDWEKVLSRLNDSQKTAQVLSDEKTRLIEEINKIKKELPAGSLVYFSQDITKIKKEVGKLKKISEDVHLGKAITLNGLLGIDVDRNVDAVQQLYKDIQSIKNDLNTISSIISDVLAGQCAEIACKSQ